MRSLLTRLARWLGVGGPRPDFAQRLASAIQREEGVMLRVSALERSLDARHVATRRPFLGNPHEE